MVDGGETLSWVFGWCELGEEEADEEELAGLRALCFGGKETERRGRPLFYWGKETEGRPIANSRFV